jgi:hypothetical protein
MADSATLARSSVCVARRRRVSFPREQMESSMVAQQQLPPGMVPTEPARTFRERVAKINVSDAFFTVLAEEPDPRPIVNLNFLRYRPRGDASRYNLYGAAAGKAINSVGGTVVFHAGTLDGGAASAGWSDAWDGVALPVYPRRASYNGVQQHKSYQLAIPDRVAGTFERLLYVLSDGTVSITHLHDSGDSIAVEAGDVFVAELLCFAGRMVWRSIGSTPTRSGRSSMPLAASPRFRLSPRCRSCPSSSGITSPWSASHHRTHLRP